LFYNNGPTKFLSPDFKAGFLRLGFQSIPANPCSEVFYQTEFKPIIKRQFETSEVMRIFNIRHVTSE
jgi:hypothetical protein